MPNRRFGRLRNPLLRTALYSGLGATLLAPLSDAFATSYFRFENRRENAGALRLLPEVSFYSTTENFDTTGTKTPVAGLTSYKKTGIDLTGVYGITRELSVFGRLSFASVSFSTTSPSLEANGSGLTEQGLGANYRLWESGGPKTEGGQAVRNSAIDAQLQLDIPVYDNVSMRLPGSRTPLRGDGTFDVTFAGFGTLPLNQGSGTRMYLLGGAGYTLRNNGYSNAIPYQLQFVGLPEQSGLLYRVGLHGFKSLTSDPGAVPAYSPQAQTSPNVLDPQDAGRSLIVDALNSSYLSARATLGYQWGDGDQVFASYVLPLSGTSTAAITGILIGAQIRMQVSKPGAAPAADANPRNAYDIEARVKQANDRLNLIKIDRGENDGIEKGNTIDIFRVNADGMPADLVARGVVTGLSANEAVVNLRQYKKEIWIQPGFVARRIAPKKTP